MKVESFSVSQSAPEEAAATVNKKKGRRECLQRQVARLNSIPNSAVFPCPPCCQRHQERLPIYTEQQQQQELFGGRIAQCRTGAFNATVCIIKLVQRVAAEWRVFSYQSPMSQCRPPPLRPSIYIYITHLFICTNYLYSSQLLRRLLFLSLPLLGSGRVDQEGEGGGRGSSVHIRSSIQFGYTPLANTTTKSTVHTI